ncbi:MAG: hypothetical protein J3T61_00040 [Candidatus Brocadiales bacterium]|nr:hypothetical protein [Candidatus Bathyanammoxibius sp.]
MTQHSPGPWTFEQPYAGFSSIKDVNGALVFGIANGADHEKQPEDVCEANAALIAAAPALLEALRHIERMGAKFTDRGQPIKDAEKLAHAAIAKHTRHEGG